MGKLRRSGARRKAGHCTNGARRAAKHRARHRRPARGGEHYYPANNRGGCANFDLGEAANITGKMVLLDWTLVDGNNECGSVTRTGKVAAAGGTGVIMAWPEPGDAIPISITGSTTIPSVITNETTGTLMKERLAAPATVNVTLSNAMAGSFNLLIPDQVDTLSGFTSRGPRLGDSVLKPDIAAPGQSIYSVGFNPDGGNLGESLNGTSMAAPHVAGAAALLRQLHPSWTPEEIKALLMNTASVQARTGGATGDAYSPSRQGAGRVVLTEAASSSVIAFDGLHPERVSVSYGVLEVGSSGEYRRSVRIVNKGNASVTFDLSTEDSVVVGGVTSSVVPSQVTVAAGDSATVELVLGVDPASFERSIDPASAATVGGVTRHFPNEHGGRLLLTPSGGGQTLQLPFHAILRPASDIHAAGSGMRFGGDNSVDLGLLGTQVAGAGYEPMLWALQLQASSPALPAPADPAGDIRFVGAGSSILENGSVTADTRVFFGIATHGGWSLPTEFDIYIDSDRDGTFDYVVYNTATSGNHEVYKVNIYDLGNDTSVEGDDVNAFPASVSTEPMNSSVLVLPVSAGQIGLSAGQSRFNYRVYSFPVSGGNSPTDSVDNLSFDIAAPALNASAGNGVLANGRPLHSDAGGTVLTVSQAPASSGIDKPAGLLLLHLLNRQSGQAEVVPLLSFFGDGFED